MLLKNYVEIILANLFLLRASINCQPAGFNPFQFVRLLAIEDLNFAVFLDMKDNNCSGTIIHLSWVLTAARCLHDDEGHLVKAKEVRVLAGVSDYTKPRVVTAQERLGAQIIVHPDYRANTLSKFDLAIIKVNRAFEATVGVGKASLAAEQWPAPVNGEGNRSRTCLTWGFGNISPTTQNSRLKIWRTVASYGPGMCPCANKFQAKRVVCGSEARGVNLCRGDLGSSLLCYTAVNPFQRLWASEYHPDSTVGPRLKSQLENGIPTSIPLSDDRVRLKVYGVAHMTLDRYMCEIARVPKRECVNLPTIAAYMYLCPFNNWLHNHVPDIPTTPKRCSRSTSLTTNTPFLFLCIFVMLVS